jgi:hypothetical protein
MVRRVGDAESCSNILPGYVDRFVFSPARICLTLIVQSDL